MAGLSDVLRSAVAIANTVTATLQPAVRHAAWDGTYTRSGAPNHKSALSRKALVEKKQELKIAPDGSEKVTQTKVTFLSPIAVNLLDQITLLDGSTPKILAIESPLDDEGSPFVTIVWL